MTNITNQLARHHEKFMQVCQLTPTTVNIISTNGPGGLAAQTINSVMIASYNPPMIAISVESDSPMTAILLSNRSFTVNVLGINHDLLADTFSHKSWKEKNVWELNCGSWNFNEENSSHIQAKNCIEKTISPLHNLPYDNYEKAKTSQLDAKENTAIAPYLDDAVAVLRCEVTTTMHMGSNIMYLGSVQDILYHESPALLYHNSHYCSTAVTVPSYFS